MSIEIRSVISPISGEPMPNVKQLKLKEYYVVQLNTLWATEIERLQACERALAIAETALRRVRDNDVDSPEGLALTTGERASCGCYADYGHFEYCDKHGPEAVARDALTAIEAAKAGQG